MRLFSSGRVRSSFTVDFQYSDIFRYPGMPGTDSTVLKREDVEKPSMAKFTVIS